MPVTPRHVVTFDGIIEEEETGQVPLELSYIGRQALEDEPYRTVSRPCFSSPGSIGLGATY